MLIVNGGSGNPSSNRLHFEFHQRNPSYPDQFSLDIISTATPRRTSLRPDHPEAEALTLSAIHAKMERDLDNANPTILSVSQLPSRSRKGAAARRGPDSKCDGIVYPKHHWIYGSSSSSEEDDDCGEEPVDAQDVYGKSRRRRSGRGSP